MKLLVTACLFTLSIAAVRAQTAPANAASTVPLGGYYVVFPQVPLTTVRFDGNSEDIAKVLSAPRTGTGFNHDGSAFNNFVRSTSSDSYTSNGADPSKENVADYQQNIKSGKWKKFVNGE